MMKIRSVYLNFELLGCYKGDSKWSHGVLGSITGDQSHWSVQSADLRSEKWSWVLDRARIYGGDYYINVAVVIKNKSVDSYDQRVVHYA